MFRIKLFVENVVEFFAKIRIFGGSSPRFSPLGTNAHFTHVFTYGALTSLKYFCENAPDYHIIVAGSLLGVAVNRAKFSFPVGKVDMKTLYPMDMEEFVLALGEDDLVEQIKKCFNTDTPLPPALHDAAMQLYRQYLVVGGMPECVMQFAETKDYILVRHTQDTILASYLNDMSKYNNLKEIKKTRLAYDNITVQLSKKNTRFQYKLIKKGGRASA